MRKGETSCGMETIVEYFRPDKTTSIVIFRTNGALYLENDIYDI